MGGTLAGNALSLAAARATLGEVLTDEAFERMIALRERFAAGVEAAIAEHGMPWSIVSLGARCEYRYSPEPPRTGAESAAAGDPALDEYLHLYLMNRGVLITPFHNMALMCPATTEEQVDRTRRSSARPWRSSPRELLRAHRGAAARDRVARLRGPRARVHRGVHARHDADPAARPGRRDGRGRGRGLRRARPREPAGRRAEDDRPRRLLHARLVLEALEETRAVPGAAGARRGVRAATGAGRSSRRRSTWRCRRPAARSPTCSSASRGRSTSWSRCGWAAGRPADEPEKPDRVLRAARALPRHEAEARPHQPLDAGAGRRAGGDGRRRLARPEGPVQGHAGGRGDRPGALPDGDRGVPERLARGPGRERRDAADPRPGERPRDLGRADPLGGRRAGDRPWQAADGEHQAVALRPAQQPVRDVRLVRARGGQAPTAAARPSSVPGRGHIQYLASLFHPDTPNDTAPSGYNNPQLPEGLPTSPLEPRIAPAGFRWQQ